MTNSKLRNSDSVCPSGHHWCLSKYHTFIYEKPISSLVNKAPTGHGLTFYKPVYFNLILASIVFTGLGRTIPLLSKIMNDTLATLLGVTIIEAEAAVASSLHCTLFSGGNLHLRQLPSINIDLLPRSGISCYTPALEGFEILFV